jgi:hypothetical protein
VATLITEHCFAWQLIATRRTLKFQLLTAFKTELSPFTIVKLALWALHLKPSILDIKQFESL